MAVKGYFGGEEKNGHCAGCALLSLRAANGGVAIRIPRGNPSPQPQQSNAPQEALPPYIATV